MAKGIGTVVVRAEGEGAARELANAVRTGKVAVFPTETVYGIGCDATSAGAVRKVFSAKKRPAEKALPVVVSSVSQIEKYAQISPLARFLARKFLPGPLTMVIPLKKGKKLAACGRGKTIAFRVSSLALLRNACRLARVPIVATSANVSGKPAVQSFEQAKLDFLGKVDLMVAAGKLAQSEPSTIIDLAHPGAPVFVREGAIAFSRVRDECKKFGEKMN